MSIFPIGPSIQTQGTWEFSINNSFPFNGILYNSTSANGDNCTWKVALDAGTYNLYTMYTKGGGLGILQILLDGTEIDSIDEYNGVALNNLVKITSFNVATKGIKALKANCNGKNASSSGYQLTISAIQIERTA